MNVLVWTEETKLESRHHLEHTCSKTVGHIPRDGKEGHSSGLRGKYSIKHGTEFCFILAIRGWSSGLTTTGSLHIGIRTGDASQIHQTHV
jgi:hypothetical protein